MPSLTSLFKTEPPAARPYTIPHPSPKTERDVLISPQQLKPDMEHLPQPCGHSRRKGHLVLLLGEGLSAAAPPAPGPGWLFTEEMNDI